MFVVYDPILVLISILVSIVGAYTCFDLVVRIRKEAGVVSKKLLISAAVIIGVSIWAMHFIGMLAVSLPVEVRYDLLTTLISGLVSISVTAIALLIISVASYSFKRITVAGTIMGLGIACMHYVGMSSIRGNCGLSYSTTWIIISILIGIVASTASMWAAIKLRGVRRRVIAALVMGVSISGVHYAGMFGTTYLPINKAIEFSQPFLSQFSLGLITAVIVFIILGGTLLAIVPAKVELNTENIKAIQEANGIEKDIANNVEHAANPLVENQNTSIKLPVQKNKKTILIELDNVVSISANGHYTTIHTDDGLDHFCNYSLSKLEKELDIQDFLRVHRSHFVRLSKVKSFEKLHNKGIISMHDHDDRIPISRTYLGKFQKALRL